MVLKSMPSRQRKDDRSTFQSKNIQLGADDKAQEEVSQWQYTFAPKTHTKRLNATPFFGQYLFRFELPSRLVAGCQSRAGGAPGRS